MPIDMLLHDKRLAGTSPAIAENIYDFDGTASIAHILGWTRVVADGAGGLRRLIIMCHGFVSSSSHRGGWGLQLGKEGVTYETAPLFVNLRGKVSAIILYSCKSMDIDAPAGQSGMILWKQIASYAQCRIVGSSSNQTYTYGVSSPIDFGKWEGSVFIVAPNGNSQVIDPDFSLE
jgi:hypothetical protein